ncbi:uncharacterized protein LAJ45_11441 [Morchella importuna]|uniref:uncharacterized protein n=1 Tax=Morchella importuna TaxID=1174673 RepID=UPI001E8CEEC9|nr:uncharacterized protein LAJ45_11441 [Morchella importuna]KAH8144544.1 hypothetical protein LAJ45_11441 [Morchella importuna]
MIKSNKWRERGSSSRRRFVGRYCGGGVGVVDECSCGYCGLSNECLLWGLEAVCRKWEFVLKGGEKLLGEGENSVKLLVCVRSARASVAMDGYSVFCSLPLRLLVSAGRST